MEVANRLIFGEDLEGKSVKARLSVFPLSLEIKGEEGSTFDEMTELFNAPEDGGFTMPMAVDKETFEEKHLAPGTALVVDGTIVAEMLELSAQNE